MRLGLITLVVRDYDEAIAFFVGSLGFDLIEDSASNTNDGRPKRWVVVAPGGEGASLLLARADGAEQSAIVGNQTGGRVGFFLQAADFDAQYTHMRSNGVTFLETPRNEAYGRVAVFMDVAGNRWDLIGPMPAS